MALEYMNKQNALKTRYIYYSNEWETFKSLETRGRIDSRGWFGTFADAAGALYAQAVAYGQGLLFLQYYP